MGLCAVTAAAPVAEDKRYAAEEEPSGEAAARRTGGLV